jgi:hypothetical protein
MASGNTLLIFVPFQNEPPTTLYATINTRNNHTVLDFDDGTNESAIFTGVMPQNYSATTGITVIIHFTMTSAIINDVDWDVSFERIGTSQDVDSDSFAAVKSANNVTVPGTAGVVGQTSIQFTDGAEIDSILAGELFRIKITRDAVSDTASGDANLHLIELRET